MNTIGERLRAFRKSLDDDLKTQEGFAKKIGTEQPNVSNWENNTSKPEATQIVNIARAFKQLNIVWLWYGGDPSEMLKEPQKLERDTVMMEILYLKEKELLNSSKRIQKLEAEVKAANDIISKLRGKSDKK